MTLDRRTVLARAAASVAGGWLAAGCTGPDTDRPSRVAAPTPGPRARAARQVDVLDAPPPRHAEVAALDLRVTGHRPVAEALRRLAGRAEDATDATVIVGLGASLFDRAGLADRRPRQLRAMPAFPSDLLDPARCHGDVLVEVGSADPGEAARALDRIVGGAAARWRITGFLDGVRTDDGKPIATNLFGFAEGHGNPAAPTAVEVSRVSPARDEPPWSIGGSYQVVRIIRLATAFWDREPVAEQERIIGRRRDGRWLDGTAANTRLDLRTDPGGARVALDSHVRRARSRTGDPAPMLRRGYSFRATVDGRAEAGLLFIAYQQDLAAGFEAVQRRLAGERLTRYALTVGGGYFFVPPTGASTWWGEALFAPAGQRHESPVGQERAGIPDV